MRTLLLYSFIIFIYMATRKLWLLSAGLSGIWMMAVARYFGDIRRVFHFRAQGYFAAILMTQTR